MADKVRVYVSFDYDNDKDLKDFVVGQSRLSNSPFEVADWSIKEEVTGNWVAEAERRIRAVDVVLVMLGKYTHSAQGVRKEVDLAVKNNKKIAQVIGHKGSTPRAVPGAGRVYNWNWDSLQRILRK